MKEVEAQLSEKRIRLELTPAARVWLAERGYDTTFGARPLGRLIQAEIKDVLAEEILFGRLKDGGHVIIGRVGEEADAPEDSTLATESLVFHFVKAA